MTNALGEHVYAQWKDNIEESVSLAMNAKEEIVQTTSPCEPQLKLFKISLVDKARASSLKWHKLKRLMKAKNQAEIDSASKEEEN